MALSTDINLPRAHAARFPNRCVVCDKLGPASHVRLMTGTLGWWTWLLWWWGKPFVVKAPACGGCGWKLHGLRLLSLCVTIAIGAAMLWLIWPTVKDMVPRGLQKWAMMGLALVCLVPKLIFDIFYAKPFEITAYADNVDYEFASQDYAVKFAMLNIDAEWVKVNDEIINQQYPELED
jgi:hypothetical protein